MSSIIINNQGIWINGIQENALVFTADLHQNLTLLYKYLEIDYSKFYKMDHLSKLAFLGVEFLAKSVDLTAYKDDDIGLHFQNVSSSLDTDITHQQNIDNNGKARPATFVYTLPNIALGEIAIRNQWFGENLFTLSERFDLDAWQQISQALLDANKCVAVIGGWVEVLEDKMDLQLHFHAKAE